MSNTVGIGVVGTGAIGIRGALEHLTMPDVQDRVRVVAVCDPVPGRAESASSKYNVPAHYESYDDLLADSSVDAVTLCTPIGLHYEQGMAAIRKGKHIHFNKTMTTKVSEATELIESAKKAGIRMVASPGMMLHPHNRRIRRSISGGEIGRLCWAATGASGVGEYHMNEEFRTGEDILTDVDPSWYFRKPGGGPQYDVTVYCLHTLTGILGPAKRVTAVSGMVIPERDYHGKKIVCDMDDTTFILVDFGDNLFAFVYAAATGNLTEGFNPTFFGTRGSIVGTKLGDVDLKHVGEYSPHVSGEHIDKAESHVFEDMMQLVRWVRDDKPSIVTVEHARHVIDIIESGYRSAESGRACDLTTSFESRDPNEAQV